ncbi:unnamed protein product [Oncorhynchus mykiss]|uniref:Tc1-like transposase DDE domain-containing protein n=1 Tax=Oncorhynchus mykiss TaxID=8022 RepID=A0A060X7N2_ONCMY|nr:unnamed protein product [Oncorhynchus mykiss]
MTWSPQSPDLNPVEMVWDELDCRVKEKQPTSAVSMCPLPPVDAHLQWQEKVCEPPGFLHKLVIQFDVIFI